MKRLVLLLLFFFTGIFLGENVVAQEKCATDLLPANHKHDHRRFEDWIDQKIEERHRRFGIERTEDSHTVIQIPIVVHIVHRGEVYGTGVNITDEQIFSQLEVLNEDFRRTNADTVSTPFTFRSVAADLEIEFVLAVSDPNGLPTTGINRVQGTQNQWNPNFNSDYENLPAQSYWPAEDYLNIWVTDLASPFLGYAQFPVASGLPGLESAINDRLTDGVVIDFRVFGSIDKYPQANLSSRYNRGRTTTHEIGHFLGLRHIWGDGSCTEDDFCADTPAANRSNVNYSSCIFPGADSCTEDALPDMFQNYMDYTDDICMNLFTQDQKDRVLAVLNNSPRRFSLPSSPGLIPPDISSDFTDLAVVEIESPSPAICEDNFTPTILFENTGIKNIGSFVITLSINAEEYLYNVQLDSLSSGESVSIEFDPFDGIDGHNFISVEVESVNNDVDQNLSNNFLGVNFLINDDSETLPLRENFSFFSNSTWSISNPDNERTWELIGSRDFAMSFPASEYPNQENEDWLISPLMNFSQVNEASLFFDLSYSGINGLDRLQILYSADCGETYQSLGYELFGAGSFTTNGYERQYVSLDPLIGLTEVRLAFVASSGGEADINVDNIEIFLEDDRDLIVPEDEIAVYPNPTSDNVFINFNLDQKETVKIQLYDANGKFKAEYIFDNTLNQTHTLILNDQPKGVYLLRILGDSFQKIEKVVLY